MQQNVQHVVVCDCDQYGEDGWMFGCGFECLCRDKASSQLSYLDNSLKQKCVKMLWLKVIIGIILNDIKKKFEIKLSVMSFCDMTQMQLVWLCLYLFDLITVCFHTQMYVTTLNVHYILDAPHWVPNLTVVVVYLIARESGLFNSVAPSSY